MLATDFNRLVRIQRRVPSGDGFTWAPYKQAWVKKLIGPGGEIFAGNQVLSQTDCRFLMPWTDGIDATMRVVDRDEIWNIVHVASDDETGRNYLTLRVSGGTNEG